MKYKWKLWKWMRKLIIQIENVGNTCRYTIYLFMFLWKFVIQSIIVRIAVVVFFFRFHSNWIIFKQTLCNWKEKIANKSVCFTIDNWTFHAFFNNGQKFNLLTLQQIKIRFFFLGNSTISTKSALYISSEIHWIYINMRKQKNWTEHFQ